MMKINYDGTLHDTMYYKEIRSFCNKCNNTSFYEQKRCYNCGNQEVVEFNKEIHSPILIKDKNRTYSQAKALNTVVVMYELFHKIKSELPYKFDLEIKENSNISAYINVVLYNKKKGQTWDTLDLTIYTNRSNLAHHTEDYSILKYTRTSKKWHSSCVNSKQLTETENYLNKLIEDGTVDYILDRLTYPYTTVFELF